MTTTDDCTVTGTPIVVNGLDATIKTLLGSFLHNPALLNNFHIPRLKLRLATIQTWGVREGDHLVDIGCGQGESSLALATVVGDRGHVSAIDPAPLDYGDPFNMREAHDHIRQSALGPRVSFYQADAPSFLADQRPDRPLDGAVLCQSLFYFPDERQVKSLFMTLRGAGISPVYVSEWSYAPSSETQAAHVLATTAQALYYRYKPAARIGVREQNVRAGVDQQAILRAAKAAGYRIARETLITPGQDMLEGQFEVRYVLGPLFQQRVADAALSKDQEAEIAAVVQELREEIEKKLYSGGASVRAMDVWAPVFELAQ
ncbi:SAM-dependent methyltransferase [Cordyceps militaris]|uniref:SAM-dependent methyltransferase n=1 Tax=Cordyceps militaris TaxID=73501 RepID=A0A2H4SB46_CORMI|nr:SAM-dependent methyltransferase [Cordyceps militaris]